MVTVRYLVVAGAYCWLLVVTARYRSLLLVHTLEHLKAGLSEYDVNVTAQKMKFSIKDLFSKYEKTVYLVTFIEEILHGKFHFMCSV